MGNDDRDARRWHPRCALYNDRDSACLGGSSGKMLHQLCDLAIGPRERPVAVHESHLRRCNEPSPLPEYSALGTSIDSAPHLNRSLATTHKSTTFNTASW